MRSFDFKLLNVLFLKMLQIYEANENPCLV